MFEVSSSLSEVPFASLLVYSPRGTSDIATRSRTLVSQIKADAIFKTPAGQKVSYSQHVARRVRESWNELPFGTFLGPDVVLVPVPRSSLLKSHALWPPYNIARELVAEGLGTRVSTLLQRQVPVRKAAWSPRGQRPTPDEHRWSLEVVNALDVPPRVTLVDDIITKGATMLGAALKLREVFPDVEIRGFAVVRTMGLQPTIEGIWNPCLGTIRLVDGDAERAP